MEATNIKKEYSNDEVTVVWEAGKCIHSGNCVQNNPDVFQPKEKPWIKIEASSTEKIIETVNKCPSGALTFYKKNKLTNSFKTGHLKRFPVFLFLNLG